MRAVNLLTPELRSAQKGSGASRPSMMESSGGLGAFIALGVLALCVVGVAGSVMATNVVKERKASLAEISAKNEATLKRATELKPYADFETLVNERASTVKALASARFDWEQALRDLSRALPSNVYLSSVKGTLGGGGSTGGSGIRTSIGSPALELAGCTTRQPAVATLLARVRGVLGFPRDSLSKSYTAAAAAGGTTTGPCAGKAPPTFEVVMFFEKATVETALADATGAVAAGATPAATPDPKASDGSAAKPASTPATKAG
jgi:Tfp pilus assembly protein PilN